MLISYFTCSLHLLSLSSGSLVFTHLGGIKFCCTLKDNRPSNLLYLYYLFTHNCTLYFEIQVSTYECLVQCYSLFILLCSFMVCIFLALRVPSLFLYLCLLLPKQVYLLTLLIRFTLEKIIYLMKISELRNIHLDDCRQSSTSAHVHCLRNEQCTCTYDLNEQDGHQQVSKFDQVLDQTIKLLVKSYKDKKRK